MYANPRALEAPEVRHKFPQFLMATTLDARGGVVQCAEEVDDGASEEDVAAARRVLDLLTPQQRRVALLIAEGKSNHLIAKRMNCAFGTVKVHVRDLMRRLRVKRRVAVAAMLSPLASGRPAVVLPPAVERVARMVAAGRTNGEIASTCGVAISTVCSHLRRAMEATGSANRAALAAWAVRNLPAEG